MAGSHLRLASAIASVVCVGVWALQVATGVEAQGSATTSRIGREVAIPRHLEDDEEFSLSISQLLAYGQQLFSANWTEQEGGGRPLSKGTGKQLSDQSAPLTG